MMLTSDGEWPFDSSEWLVVRDGSAWLVIVKRG